MKSCFLSTARVGLKGPTGTFFSIFLENKYFFCKKDLYILVNKKNVIKKKRFPTDRLAVFFYHPVRGNDNSFKDGLMSKPSTVNTTCYSLIS